MMQSVEVENQVVLNNDLFSIQNEEIFSGLVNISNSVFWYNTLQQSQENLGTSVFRVSSFYEITMVFSNCTFTVNKATTLQYSQTESSTALVLKSVVGSAKIYNSLFSNSYSSWKANFVQAQLKYLSIEDTVFQNSSYLHLQECLSTTGGFLRLVIQDLFIRNASFLQSQAFGAVYIFFDRKN